MRTLVRLCHQNLVPAKLKTYYKHPFCTFSGLVFTHFNKAIKTNLGFQKCKYMSPAFWLVQVKLTIVLHSLAVREHNYAIVF